MKKILLKIFKKNQVEEKLLYEKKKLIIKNFKAITYQIDTKKPEVISIDDCVEELTGYKAEDFIKGDVYWSNIIHEEDLKIFLTEAIKLATRDDYTADIEYRIICKNQKTKWVRDIANSVKINSKKYIIGTIYDISSEKEKEEELLLLKNSINNARVPIFWIGEKGEILFVNKAACQKLEYNEEELLNMTVFDIDPNIKWENWDAHWEKTLEKYSYTFQTTHKTKSGKEFPVEIYVDTIKLKDKYIHSDFVIDISERKAYEKEIINAKEKAEIADRLKTAFLSQMSHEIRTPLQKILGFVSLIKDYLETNTGYIEKEIEEYFALINLSSKRLIRTIDTILNMSEMQLNSYTPIFIECDLHSLLYNIYNNFKFEAELKKLKFNFIVLTNNTTARIDEYSTIQIFENLIDNAIKYTNSGEVKIIIGRDNNNSLYVEIDDTGIGMHEDFIKKLFRPFSQEEIGYKRRYEGLGLGLALVKKYCDLNNASIDIKSAKGEGTTIIITFNSSSGTNLSNTTFHRFEQNRY